MHFRWIMAAAALAAGPAYAAPKIDIALIRDGQMQQLLQIEQAFRDELVVLTEGEFDVRFKPFDGRWTQSGIEQAFEQAYRDPEVDLLLVVGVTANQIGVVRGDFPKPTFLPFVFDAQLLQAPAAGNRSGMRNLNYLTDRVEFSEDLATFRRVAPFAELSLIADGIILSAVPNIVTHSRQLASTMGVNVHIISHDGQDHRLADMIPENSDAVMLAGLPRMPDDAYQGLINDVNERRLPSFSLVGVEPVLRGLLASDAPPTDWQRLARRNALNMQAVMLGERAQDQPILFEGKRELTINLETARKIGLSPRFDVLSEAVLLNQEPEASGPMYSLAEVARLAVQRNLDLASESLGVSAGSQDVVAARSSLFPQLSAGTAFTRRKVSPLVETGQFAEKSSDGSLSLSQIIYADDVSAALEIQQQLQYSREAVLQQLRLDTIEQATVSYLNVLRSETQLRIQQDNLNLTKANLELARDRVRVGSTSLADVYRWESRIATDRSSLLRARAALDQAREALNRILHQPITQSFQIVPAELEDPFVMTETEFNDLIDNPHTLSLFTDYSVRRGLENSPELTQLEAQLAAKRREIVNQRRAFWLPDFSVNGSYSKNFDQNGVGAGLTENLEDWNVSLQASIPLFAGGARKAALSRANYEFEQLGLARDSIREKLEQQIRATMHAANASYANIGLSQQAADAGRKNLELVTDSYAKGVVSIIDLLDAQNASLQADEAAANALYDFLIDIMGAQRSVGQFDFLLPAERQQQAAAELRNYIASGGRSSH